MMWRLGAQTPLSARLLLMTAFALLLTVSGGMKIAQSQTSTALVSNLAETSDAAGLSAGSDTGTAVSQGFDTGGSAGGYLLTGVSVVIHENNFGSSDTATFKIYDSESNGTPRDEIYTLTTPAALTVDSTVFFAAPSDARLDPNKKYHVVFQGTGDALNNNLDLKTTASNRQTGETGWTIENAFRAAESLSPGGLAVKISIQGSELPPLVSNLAETDHSNALRVGRATGTRFSQAFGTGDNAGGYLLTGVSVEIDEVNFSGAETATFKIYDSEADGTPKSEVYTLVTPRLTAGATVSFAAPSGAKLEPNENYHVVFQGTGNVSNDLGLVTTASDAQTGETGWNIEDAYRVNEGISNRGLSAKMSIHGVANSAATGDPTISGASAAGLTLTADTTAIMDADGLSNVSYSYQWIRVDADGTSNQTPITGATGATYTLTSADAGKRVRVRVSFTDDNSVPEERTSNAYPSTGTVLATLVSNLAETNHASDLLVGNVTGTSHAQGFGAGGNAGGYLLTGVIVEIDEVNFSGAETATFKIYDSEADGTPKDAIYTLTTPTLTAGSTAFFAAPSGAILEPNKSYHVVFQGSGNDGNDLKLGLTSSDAQTGESGWSIEDAYRFEEALSGFGNSIKMGIQGTAVPPLVSNLAETAASTNLGVGNQTGTGLSQGFGTGSHDGGYLLTGVSVAIAANNFTGAETATFKIYDSETNGTPKSEVYTLTTPTLTAGSTVFFAAPSGAMLDPNENYHVVFQGTGNDSADLLVGLTASNAQTGEAGWTIEDAYRATENLALSGNAAKIGIYGVANSAATGDPTISGDATVGRTLTADATAIMDADGLSNVSYSYQWIRVDADGTSNSTPIAGATGSAYTLTNEDAGKKVRVRVSFTDDISVPEERTSDAYPSAGTVAEVPTLVSNLAETTSVHRLQVGNRSGTTVSQGFSTGVRGGVMLSGVSFAIHTVDFSSTETATFKIYSSESDGTPKEEIYALTTPDTLTDGETAFFTAPQGATLDSGENYHVVFQGTGDSPSDLSLEVTESTAQAGETGWTIEGSLRVNENLYTTGLTGLAFKMSIHGTETALTPLVSNLAETTHASRMQVGNATGTSGSQGFGTGSGDGYLLTGVSVAIAENNFSGSETATFKIYDSESNGTPKNEIYALTTPTLTAGRTAFFAAPSGAMLDPNKSYHVVFQGTGNVGNDLRLEMTESDIQTGTTGWTIENVVRLNESLHTNDLSVKIGIHGAANNAATGDPTISGDPRVGLTLAAGTSAIADADGLSNVSYAYQWIRVDADGTSNPTPITGATGTSYTLTGAEGGKRVRIRVSFSDENGVPEVRTSDAYPATRTVTEEPTLISNRAETTDSSVLPVGDTTGTELSQGFGTGSNAGGYLLTGVSVLINYNNFGASETATFKIYDSESNGTPKNEIYALTTPTLREGSTVLFTAPSGATLEPDTNYHVVFQGTANSANDLRLPLTDSDAQTGEAGLTIEDGYRHNESFDPGGTSVKIGIHGTVLPTLVSNLAETTHATKLQVGNRSGTSASQGFGTGSHASGYPLTGVSVAIAENNFSGSETATFKIYDSENDGTPKSEVYTLTTPTLTAGSTVFFAAPSGAMLDPNENYHVVFQGMGSTNADLKLDMTASDVQTGQTSWTIENAFRASESIDGSGRSVKMGIHGFGDREPPTLHAMTTPVLAADGRTLTITFNEAMKTTSVPVNSAFTVKATPMGGSEETLALATSGGVTVSGSTAVLKMAKPIAHNDGSVTVKYDKPGSGSVLQDAPGNDLASFTDQAVTNNSVIPRVSISTTDADWTPTLAHADFTFTRSNVDNANDLYVNYEVAGAFTDTGEWSIEFGGTASIMRPSHTGNASGAVTFTVVGGDDHLPALAPNNSATVQLKVPASGNYVTISHRQTSYMVTEGQSVDHNVDFVAHAGVAQPRDSIGVSVSSNFNTGTASSGDDFAPVSESSSVLAGEWTASGQEWKASKRINLQTIDDDEYEGDETLTARFQRSAGGNSKITWAPGTEQVTFTIQDNDTLGVTGITVTSTPTDDYYTANNPILFEVAFNANVTVTGTPRLAFDIGGQTRYASYIGGSDSRELTFSYTVPADAGEDLDGISWGANSLERNGGTIKFMTTDVNARVDADLNHVAQSALPGHKVDTTKPTLATATVSATTMTLEFSEDLNTTAPALSAFSGKKTPSGASETTLTFTGTPSISGSTVTLTLATASSVSASDTDVKVSYTKPNSNPIKDLRGHEADAFSDKGVGNSLAESVPPQLHGTTLPVLAADGKTLTITINEPLLEGSVPANSAFTVKATPAGSTEATVALATTNGVTVSGSTVVLKLDPGIAHNDTSVKVSYAMPGSGSVLEDLAGNDLASFTDQAVTNNSAIPRVSIEAVDADASSGIASPEFRFARSLVTSSPLTIFSTTTQADTYILSTPDEIAIAGDDASKVYSGHLVYGGNTSGDLTVTLSAGSGYLPALAPNNSATVRVKAPATGKPINVLFPNADVRVAEGDTASVAVDVSLTAGLAEPRESYTVTLRLVDEEAEVDVDFEDPPGNIEVEIAPSDWQNAVGGGKTYRINQQVTTIEDAEVEANETLHVELFVSGLDEAILGLPEIDETGHRTTVVILDDEDLVISSVAVTSSQTDGYYSAGDDITFEVTFNAYVTVDTTDGTPQLEFDTGGQTRMAAAEASEEEMEATFTYTVLAADVDDHDGISWGANAITLSGGTIVIPAKESPVPRNANLDHVAQPALPGHKVDTSKPTLTGATVNATSITLVFSEDLNTTAPAITAFSGKKTPSGASETALTIAGVPATISGSTVTLTLATASSVSATDTGVKVSYTKPSNNPIKDLRGHEADAFSDSSVRNQLADSTPPQLHAMTAPVLAADGRTLTITFNEAMKTTSVPVNSAFTVKATPMGGSEETLALATSGGVTVSGSTAVLKMAKPIAHNDGSVTVKYDKPGSGSVLQDAPGNDLASFTDTAVTNNSTIPRVSISTTDTDWTPTLAHADFTLTRSNTDSTNDLNVDYEVTGAYTETGEGEISLNDTTGILRPSYSGNASGAVTFTVVGGDDHLPALAPNNSATVQLKTPASGNYVTISHGLTSHSLTEGVSVTYSVNFVAHAGVAQPRDPIGVDVSSNSNTGTASSGDDFAPVSESITIQPGDWTASGQEWKASKRINLQTIDDDEYEGNETLTLSLQAEPGSHSKITWAPGTDVANFTIGDNDTLGVTGITVTSTPTDDYYTAGNAILFEVAFNASVTVDATSGTPQLAFDIGGQTRHATYTSGSDTNALTFSYTVAAGDGEDLDGISWAANALDRNNGTIKFTSTEPTAQVNANLNHVSQSALPGHKVDTTKPTLASAEVNATTMTLEFSEDLNTTAPALSAFSGKKTPSGASETTLTFTGTPSISGSTVTVTLATASSVSATDTGVKVSYTKPNSNPIKDLRGH